MLSAEQLQMRLPIHVSHQGAAQFKIWPIIKTDIAVVSSIQSQGKKSRMLQVRRAWVKLSTDLEISQ